MIKNTINISEKNNFYFNFISLMSLLLILSLETQIKGLLGIYAATALVVFIFVLDINSLESKISTHIIMYILIVMIIALKILEPYINPYLDRTVHHIIFLIFFTHSFRIILSEILHKKYVTTNLIVGSVTGYIHLGFIWTYIYMIILLYDPNSFNNLSYSFESNNFSEISYFSFVTLTTLGFGDISPSSGLARVFTYFEAIIGVFYMAVIVSTLVSVRLSELHKNTKEV